MFHRIVAAVDGREGGRDAGRLAALLARGTGAELVLVHVHPHAAGLRAASRDRVRREAAAILDQARRECPEAGEAVLACSVSPARALHAQAQALGADLIVLGSSQRGAPGRLLAGDTARAVLHGAPCAVALVPHRPSCTTGPLRVTAAYDGEPEAMAAVRAAARLAAALHARLRIVEAVSGPVAFSPRYAYCVDWPELSEQRREAARRDVERVAGALAVEASTAVEVGAPVRVLEGATHDCDLLVTGSRGYGPLRRVVLGSTTDALIRHAACPILVLPRTAGGSEAPVATPRGEGGVSAAAARGA